MAYNTRSQAGNLGQNDLSDTFSGAQVDAQQMGQTASDNAGVGFGKYSQPQSTTQSALNNPSGYGQQQTTTAQPDLQQSVGGTQSADMGQQQQSGNMNQPQSTDGWGQSVDRQQQSAGNYGQQSSYGQQQPSYGQQSSYDQAQATGQHDPSLGDKIKGTFEKMAGKVTNNEARVAEGDNLAHGRQI